MVINSNDMTTERGHSRPSVAVMVCFARSGGTLLNQCLGSMSGTVVLSEVTPRGASGAFRSLTGPEAIKKQACQWYGMDIKSTGFFDSILELEAICRTIGKRLIVREWTFLNYVPVEENGYAPAGNLTTLEALSGKCELTGFALVRDVFDVLVSINTRLNIPVEQFADYYMAYIKSLMKWDVKLFKYEDLTSEPEFLLEEICQFIGVEYEDILDRYGEFDNVMGDRFFDSTSRGRERGKIGPLPRRRLSRRKIDEINRCDKLVECNRLMGYPTEYGAVKAETFGGAIIDRSSRMYGRFRQRFR